MSKTFKLLIVTKKGILLEEDVISCKVKITSGYMQYLANHEDTIAIVNDDEILYKRQQGKDVTFKVSKSMLVFKNNTLKIIL